MYPINTKYNTLNDIKVRIEQQFYIVLGKDEKDTGTYSHNKSLSGNGCAIGCLFDSDTANKIQEIADKYKCYVISHLYIFSMSLRADSIDKQFLRDNVFSRFNFNNYSIDDLRVIQMTHDSAMTVYEFIINMNKYIANNSSQIV